MADEKNQESSQEDEAPISSNEDMDAEELRKGLDDEKAKAEQYLANWQRAQADFVNFRKRAEQEKGEMSKFANAMMVSSLLPVLDDFERGFSNIAPSLAGLTWVDGVKLIYRKLQGALEAQGLTPIKTDGQDFDPRFHEAVLYGEGQEGKILEELQRGYTLHDRVIRPAMVKVGRTEEQAGSADTDVGGEQGEDEGE